MEELQALVSQKALTAAYEELRDTPAKLLPAWAYEEMLRRAGTHLSAKDRITRAVFPPSTPLVDLVRTFPPYLHGVVQQGLRAVFAEWDHQLVTQGMADELPGAVQTLFPTAYGQEQEAFGEATFLLAHPAPRKFVAHVEMSHSPFDSGAERSILVITCPEGDVDLVSQKLRDLNGWVRQNNVLKGKKLGADGKFLRLGRPYSWDDVFAPANLVASIRRNTQTFIEKIEEYRRLKLPTKRGILLHGGPGTGKTLLGKVLASQTRCTFVWVKPGDISSPDEIGDVFCMARDLAPTLLFLEDLDLVAGRRGRDGFTNMLLGELLNQMDGLQPNEGLLVVATTNDLGAIEPALTNRPQRFDCIMEIPEISDEIRRAYLERFVRDRGLNVRFLDEFDHLTSRCRTIAEVQEEAIRYLQRAIENGLDLSTVASPRELPELPPLTTCEAGAREIGFRSSRV